MRRPDGDPREHDYHGRRQPGQGACRSRPPPTARCPSAIKPRETITGPWLPMSSSDSPRSSAVAWASARPINAKPTSTRPQQDHCRHRQQARQQPAPTARRQCPRQRERSELDLAGHDGHAQHQPDGDRDDRHRAHDDGPGPLRRVGRRVDRLAHRVGLRGIQQAGNAAARWMARMCWAAMTALTADDHAASTTRQQHLEAVHSIGQPGRAEHQAGLRRATTGNVSSMRQATDERPRGRTPSAGSPDTATRARPCPSTRPPAPGSGRHTGSTCRARVCRQRARVRTPRPGAGSARPGRSGHRARR